jgi:hypothetical protein
MIAHAIPEKFVPQEDAAEMTRFSEIYRTRPGLNKATAQPEAQASSPRQVLGEIF